jgi:ADP-ribosyl-[dinitrogen reductase] hydrolase
MKHSCEPLAGGLYGLLIGDALGVPYEFHRPESLPPLAVLEMEPPAGFARAHGRTPTGTWSDDGAQALALLDSLLTCGELDLDDFGRRLVAWYNDAAYTPDNRVFDCGIQTGDAIRELLRGTPAYAAGRTDERANGNGSLMRVLPLALWHQGSDDDLIRDAHLQSSVTHGHPRAHVCCALYCLWGRYLLAQTPDPWAEATATLRGYYTENGPYRLELELHIQPDTPAREAGGTGGGYVVDCLRSARQVQSELSYEAIVKAAVALGNDTDTTACVAGGIAGLRFGLSQIPTRWRDALHGKELVENLLTRLLAHHGLPAIEQA